MKTIVRRTLAEYKLTEKQKRELAKLAARPDSAIDFSDIPPLTEKFWRNAIRNPWYRPRKQQVTLRIDADILGLAATGRQGLPVPAQRPFAQRNARATSPQKRSVTGRRRARR